MSVGLTSAVVNLKSAELGSQVQLAVAARMLKTADAQGEAVVALLEGAADMMEQATAQVVSASADLAGHVDYLA